MVKAAKTMIQTARPYFHDKKSIHRAIGRILGSGRLMMGEYCRLFEKGFARYTGTRFAVALNSCTSAMEITLRYLSVKGHEVIVPTNTFIATPNAVVYSGARPVFADIEAETFCLDPEDLKKRITHKTKAVILVHIAGLIAPGYEEIKKICRERGLFLIEDCAHAHGASYRGRKAGSLGLAGCFSFYPTKIITTGTGGMLTTDDAGLDSFARSLRLHGAGKGLSDIVRFGNDWFMDEFRAAIGFFQLRELEDKLRARRRIAKEYQGLLRGKTYLSVYEPPVGIRHAYYKFPVLLDRKVNVRQLKDTILARYGFELESLYDPPCHLQPIYRGQSGRLPVAEDVLKRQVTLPMHPLLSRQQLRYAVRALETCLKKTWS